MPKLSDAIETTKTSLPSIKGSEVEIRKDLRAGDIEKVYSEDNSDITSALKALTLLIKDWNLEDEEGKKEEINIKNVRKLTQSDILFVLKQTNFINEQDFTDAGKQK